MAGYTVPVLPFRKLDLRLAISMIRPNTQYIKTGLSGASLANCPELWLGKIGNLEACNIFFVYFIFAGIIFAGIIFLNFIIFIDV